MAKIYTKTGDTGGTALVGGQRVPKTHVQIEAYGTVDELNSNLGVVRAQLGAQGNLQNLDQQLETIQHWLFDLGSLLAATPEDRIQYKLRPLTEQHVVWLEKRIDELQTKLPALKNFILPSGSLAGAQLHVCRTVARRAERKILNMAERGDKLPDFSLMFINRLSDYLFVIARMVNQECGKGDVMWSQVNP